MKYLVKQETTAIFLEVWIYIVVIITANSLHDKIASYKYYFNVLIKIHYIPKQHIRK
jgi:hypothetical protein